MKFYTIYKITHVESGKFYIGRHVTSNLDDNYMGSGKYIRHAIEKYGTDAFTKEYLFIFDNEDDMYAKEAELVTEEFCLREDTYNIAPGGFAGGWKYINANRFQHTDSANQKRKETLRNNSSWHNAKGRKTGEFAFNGFEGKNHSDETKAKLRKSKNVGENNSQYGLQWITNGIESTRIKKDNPIPEGWKKGRKYQPLV